MPTDRVQCPSEQVKVRSVCAGVTVSHRGEDCLGACQLFCVWGLEVGGDSVGVGGGELGKGLFPVGGGASLDESLALHPLCGAAPVMWRCTRTEGV